ncbi:conserved phage C-terminal domain-containing protein [Vagococcus lutrae]|uniref:conserved phage C-terminal domain-containing protein n=1 Tax=Vagococcus lutrae TaxID=81947 RepID=UPI00288F61DA|nr:conserved phage C-terminal domain-containing protein [Vagococcus lutrae]MDT2808356.1 conserved phage C-terminal domain-containing protein [Vagococcus lutrae]
MSQNFLATSELFSKGYGFIPKVVMIDTDLTVEAKAIYGYLASYSGAGMSSYPSTKLMLKHLNMSRDRYFKHRKQLIEKGYITIKKERKNGDFCNNIYILNSEPTACTRNTTTQNATTQNTTTNSISSNSNSNNSNSENNLLSGKAEPRIPFKEIVDNKKENISKIVVTYLNDKADKNFSYKSKATQSHINARVEEGRTVDDFKAVIDLKVEQWKHDEKMNNYLRPTTLFAPTNFENYVNEALSARPKKQSNTPAPSTKSFSLDDFL